MNTTWTLLSIILFTGSSSSILLGQSVEQNCEALGVELRQSPTPTAEACAQFCTANKDCAAYTHISGWNRCFLKSSFKRTRNLRMRAMRFSEDKKTILEQKDMHDHRGKDLRNSISRSLKDCEEQCKKEVQCKGVVFMEGIDTCWLKKNDAPLMSKIFSCGKK